MQESARNDDEHERFCRPGLKKCGDDKAVGIQKDVISSEM